MTIPDQSGRHVAPAADAGAGARRPGLVLLTMCLAQAMILVDVTIVNIALPSIQSRLHESPADLEWVITAYALALAALIPVSGALGDRWGRRRLFIVGMALFTVGSIACALSGTAVELTVFRGVQGVGGAMMSALTLAILSAVYPPQRRARAIGIWATASGLGFGLGPLVGGVLIESFGWSSIFWVNVPFGIAALTLAALAVPESRNPRPRALNLPSVVLIALGLAALTFGFTRLSADPVTSPVTVISLALGVLLIGLFVWSERRSVFPMIPGAVIRSRLFDVGCAVYLCSYTALTGLMFYLTLLYQNVDGWSPLKTGLSWLAMNIPFLVITRLADRFSRAFPGSAVVAAGCVSSAIGVIVLSTLTPGGSLVTMGAGLALLGLGNGTLMPGVTYTAMREIPPEFNGTASGVLNTARQIGTSIGLAVLGAISGSVSTTTWAHDTGHVQSSAVAAQAHNVAIGEIRSVTGSLGSTFRAAATDAFINGYHVAMLVAGLCLVAAALFAAFGLRAPRTRDNDAPGPRQASAPVRAGR
jgi:MFS transporter, DHA2 family, methylenomycin A resistance protein